MKAEIEILIQNMRQCSACSFRNRGIEPLAPNPVAIPVPIMFIGENPSWADGQIVPLAKDTISGQALDKHYLNCLGLTRNQVWITDLFKCRYPLEPVDIYHAKPQHDGTIQTVVETCARLWLMQEIELAYPKIIVTLSNKEVYQRLRRAFDLPTPKEFTKVVGKPHQITLAKWPTILFPMIHPDISRPLGEGDNRKIVVRNKWAVLHQQEHIPALKELLERLKTA